MVIGPGSTFSNQRKVYDMKEVNRFRLILLVAVIACIVIVEYTGTQVYAHYAMVGLVIYFCIVAFLLTSVFYIRKFNRRRFRSRIIKDLKESPPQFSNPQALERIKRDINRYTRYN